MKRGVISAPAKFRCTDNGFEAGDILSAEEIRYLLLYWDKVIIPTNNMLHLGVSEEDILIDSGAIERPVFLIDSLNVSDGAEKLLGLQDQALEIFSQEKDTDWVVHQQGGELATIPASSLNRQIIRFELINTLPVPRADVSVYEILDFKSRRAAELEELHFSLDDFYKTILSSPDPLLANIKANSELKKAIQNFGAVTSEKFDVTKKFNFSAQLNLSGKDVFQGAAGGAFLDAYALPFGIPLGTIIGGVASAIKIQAKQEVTLMKATKMKLSYLSAANKEMLI